MEPTIIEVIGYAVMLLIAVVLIIKMFKALYDHDYK